MAKKATQIDSFNRGNIKQVRDIIQSKLDELEAVGIKVSLGSIKYSDNHLHAKVEALPLNFAVADPKVVFEAECRQFGLSKDDYRDSMIIPTRKGMKKVSFMKFDHTKRKYPVIVKDAQGNQFKMSAFSYKQQIATIFKPGITAQKGAEI